MILLTIVAVGLLTLSSVSLRASSQGQAVAVARANAKLAMMLALGELQKSTGPDQRVTARGDILAANTTNPHWTGVWKTGTKPLDSGSQPQRAISLGASNATDMQKSTNAVWLVSGTAPDPLTFSGTSTGANPTAVVLAKKLGADSTTVMAPLVPVQLSNNVRGAYAYWVSDEGVKAKVNIKDPTLNSDSNAVDPITSLAKNQLHFAAPQAMAAHKILPDTLATDFRQAAKVEQVLTPQTLPLLPEVAPAGYVSNRYLSDVTTYSYGVLADVRNGGLRKDLTAALEDTGATAATNYAKLNPNGTANVYTTSVEGIPAVTPQNPMFTGLRWLNLYYYYNLYKATLPTVSNVGGLTTPARAVRPTGIGNPDPATNPRPYAASMHALGWKESNDPVFAALTPVCLGLRWDVALSTRNSGVGYVPRLHYYPQVVLYNPFTIAIKSSSFCLKRSLLALFNGSTYSSQDFVKLQIGSVTYSAAMNQASTGWVTLQTKISESSDLAPGEIRVYGLSSATANDIPAVPGLYRNFGNNLKNSIATASGSFNATVPGGLVSQDYNPEAGNVTDMLNMVDYQTYTISAGTGGNYVKIPPQPDGPVTVSLSKYVMGGVYNGRSYIQCGLIWPFPNPDPNTVDQRLMEVGQPGSYDTGPGTLAGGKPFPAQTSYTTTLSNLDIANGYPILLWSVYCRSKGLKGETSGYTNCKAHLPTFMGNTEAFNAQNDKFFAGYWAELYVRDSSTQWQRYDFTDLFDMNMGESSTNPKIKTTSWGNRSTGVEVPANVAGSPASSVVLADVPIQPLVSLGQFMHMRPFYSQSVVNIGYASMGFGTMFTGGSYANPSVKLDTTVYDSGSANGYQVSKSYLFCDHSFLANQALFDTYYFSTVPPASLPTANSSSPNSPDPILPVRASVYPENWVAFNAANPAEGALKDSSIPFLNSRMVPYHGNGTAPTMADLRDMDKAAANLLLNGAFNINSTSIDAWRTLLSSLSGNDLSLWNASTQSEVTFKSSDLQNPIPRFWTATGNANLNSPWCGVRALSDAEITELATKIVAQVKLRGPFLSMADFLNRRLGDTASALTLTGALQAAIDNTSPDINAVAKAAGEQVSVPNVALPNSATPIAANMQYANLTTWNTATGIPGYLMQQDLVQAFSPVMAARSDTFVIRTYGQAINPTSLKVEATAYAEAVVQRVPDYIEADSATSALGAATPVASLTTGSINEAFGRRFEIISFRWLSPQDL